MTQNRAAIWTNIASNIRQRIEQTPLMFGHDAELTRALLQDDQDRLTQAEQFIAFHSS